MLMSTETRRAIDDERGVAHFFRHGAEKLDGQRRIGRARFDELERLGIFLHQRAGVDQVGGAQADAADFAHDEAEGQVGVTRQRREKQVGFKLERAKAHRPDGMQIRLIAKVVMA
jgi:hypothetical protein